MTHTLAVRLDSEGDVLLTGPAIRAIAARSDRVTLLCGPRGRQAARLLPGVDELLWHHACWIDPEPLPLDWPATTALIEGLRGLRADAAVVFTSFHQSPLPTAMLLRAAGIPCVGAISEDYPGSLLDVRHRVDDDIHEVSRALSLTAACGYPLPEEDDARLRVRRDARAPDLDRPYVVVHPGASVPARAWDPRRHERLVVALAGLGWHVVVTGGPDDGALTARVAGAHGTDLGGRTSFGELAELLAGAEVVVVGNTGPAHLAAAVGTPVVSLFAPTVPAVRWRPWGVPHVLLHVDVTCAGCRARTCPVPGHPCLSGVDVEEVVDAVTRLGTPAESAAWRSTA
jgi:ADP-heptose:LPS heptosyltransferase